VRAASRSAKILRMTSVQRRRRTRWLADLKAEALASWVTRSSERRLRSVMRGRLRGVVLWQIFRTIRQRAQPDARVDAVVEFRITGRGDGGIDRYQLRLIDGRGRRPRRDAPRPALTLELEPVAFLSLVGGTASAGRLLIAGKLKLRGNLVLALALPTALRIPRRRPRTPRQR
jgi:SCP-2 sterol transfer family